MDGVILVNKPTGVTSHWLVQQVRRKLHIDKIGHTGTLDPLANGLMLLTIGKATKILPFLSHHNKEYICTMKFGLKTDSLDSTGTILETRVFNGIDEKQASELLKSFLGDSKQVPPMYSAKKVDGKKLYELARKNIEIERKPIDITIYDIELLSLNNDEMSFRVVCSTGTYIRSLVNDIAERIGSIAIMTSLIRSKIDHYNLEDAYQVDDIDENCQLVSIYELLKDYPYIELDDYKDVYYGKPLSLNNNEDLVMIVNKEEVIAAYYKDEDGLYRSKRGLW